MEIKPPNYPDFTNVPTRNVAGHKVTSLQGEKPIDYRVKEMVRLSDQKESINWEDLSRQWEMLWVVKLNSRTQDDFNNYPQIIYSLFNPKTRNEVIMGRYDITYLFPHKRQELKSLEEDRKQKEGLIENLKAAHFKLRAQEVLRRISSIRGIDANELHDRLASLVFLNGLLKSEDRIRLMNIINKLHESKDFKLDDNELNFLVYKPLESCTTYKSLDKHFPHLKRLIDHEISNQLTQWRAKRAVNIFILWKGAKAHRELDTEVKKEKKRLESKRILSYLEIYLLECNLRKATNQPPIFE